MNLDLKHRQQLLGIIRQYLSDPEFRVFVFGSRVKGNSQKFSDVDVGIEGSRPVEQKIMYKIKDELEESDLPYFVDVVDFAVADPSFTKKAGEKREYLR